MNDLIIRLLNELSGIDEAKDTIYTYNGIKVPRVTHIISRCVHNDHLMYWANSLGLKHQSYGKYMKAVANVGTDCHKCIDSFLGEQTDISNTMEDQAYNAFQSYLMWYNDVLQSTKEFTIELHEQTITCPWFGGTLDGLYCIDGAQWLVDYKTSNHITLNHVLQTAAYRYILRTEFNTNINGIIILQLSKDDKAYSEHMFNFNNPIDLEFINQCEQTFFSLVYAYYNLQISENQFKHIL